MWYQNIINNRWRWNKKQNTLRKRLNPWKIKITLHIYLLILYLMHNFILLFNVISSLSYIIFYLIIFFQYIFNSYLFISFHLKNLHNFSLHIWIILILSYFIRLIAICDLREIIIFNRVIKLLDMIMYFVLLGACPHNQKTNFQSSISTNLKLQYIIYYMV